MKKLLLFLFFLAQPAWAVDHYISPTGTDSGSCTTAGSPCRTFAYALAATRMPAGDRLIVKNGTYSTAAATGLPSINCSSGYNNGTAANRITIIAENERQALLQGSASGLPFRIQNCNYWNIEGLRIEHGDFSSEAGSVEQGSVMVISSSSNLEVKRNLIRFNNRYFNSHALSGVSVSSTLFEENELYDFHRHGIRISTGSSNIFRRNYVNSRSRDDLVGGNASNDTGSGDSGIALYPSGSNTLENNIIEDTSEAYEVNAQFNDQANSNLWFGNMDICGIGVLLQSRGATTGLMPKNNIITNHVSLPTSGVGIWSRGSKNTQCNSCTVIGGSNGMMSDRPSDALGDGIYSFSSLNSLVTSSGTGFNMVTTLGTLTFTLNYPNSFGNTTAFTPAASHASITNELTTDPQLGSCRCWIPAASPMKGAGLSGADIGANVLYKYVNGVLTGLQLWEESTNNFTGCGAIVTGVNDTAGNSCTNVDIRLNIGTANGCAFPSGYFSPPPAPTLTLTVASDIHLFPGLVFPITWLTSDFGVDTITIEVSRDNGSTWNSIVIGTTNDNLYDWTVADGEASSNCKIRVKGVTNSSVISTSAAFRIAGKYRGNL